jgi:hypothetical protein
MAMADGAGGAAWLAAVSRKIPRVMDVIMV